MRYRMQNYQDGERHEFVAKVERLGSFHTEAGKLKKTVLLLNVTDDKGRHMAGHTWVVLDKKNEDAGMCPGKIYSFSAKVGTYHRGKSMDYQLKKITRIKELAA